MGERASREQMIHRAISNPATQDAEFAISDTSMARGHASPAIQAISTPSDRITSASRTKMLGQ
jgi:hypothetical protein